MSWYVFLSFSPTAPEWVFLHFGEGVLVFIAALIHNHFMRIISILLSGLMLVTIACSKDEKVVEKIVEIEKEIPAKSKRSTTYVVGDPSQYLYGTKLTNFILLPVLKDQILYRVATTVIKDIAEIRTRQESVKEQTPSTAKVTADELDFYPDSKLMGPLEEYTGTRGKTYFKFGLKNQSDYFLIFERHLLGLRLFGYLYKDHLYSLHQDYIHISVSEDQTVISISFLDSMYRDGTKNLSRLTFTTKKDPPAILSPQRGYMYLRGPDVLSRYDQTKPLMVNACGKDLYEHKHLMDPLVKQWKDILVGRLEIQFNYQPEGCPPFTDINTHNIYMIDAIRTTYGLTGGMGGSTYTAVRGEIFDTDIILYKHELLKSTGNFQAHEYEEYFKNLFLHEFGHFLGLDHQFDGVTESIMAYQGHKTLQPYDIEAIQALYPLINP